METVISPARTEADIADASALAWDFVRFLRQRYPERADQIDAYLSEQRFEEMLADFRTYFTPPAGECMLARADGAAVGIVMLKTVTEALCEMNRMYVTPGARGHGIGRALCKALISTATGLGFREMRLSALDRHREALPLYRSLGFGPDLEAGEEPGVIFMRMRLAGGGDVET